MRRTAWGIGALIFALAVIFGGAHWSIQRQAATRQVKQLCLTALTTVFRLQNPGSAEKKPTLTTIYGPLSHKVVPNSQASFWMQWLIQQSLIAEQQSHRTIRHVTVVAHGWSIVRGKMPWTITFTFQVTKALSPRGLSTTKGVATFWITQTQGRWLIQAVAINYDPIVPSRGPQPIQLDIWHLRPFPGMPLGRG